MKNVQSSNSIELSHIGLVFASELVRLNKSAFQKDLDGRIRFLRMNSTRRLKLIEKTIDALSLKRNDV